MGRFVNWEERAYDALNALQDIMPEHIDEDGAIARAIQKAGMAHDDAELKRLIATLPKLCALCRNATGEKAVGRNYHEGHQKVVLFSGYVCEQCAQGFERIRWV